MKKELLDYISIQFLIICLVFIIATAISYGLIELFV